MSTKSRDSYEGKSDHDLLIELNVKFDIHEDRFDSHINHHWMTTMAVITAVLSGGISLFILLIESGVFTKLSGHP